MSLGPNKNIKNKNESVVTSQATGTIFTTDGMLTDDRLVDGDNHDITFQNIDEFTVSAASVDLVGSLRINGASPKGSVIVGTNAAYVGLAVGTDGQFLIADSAQPSGIRWTSSGIGDTNIYNTSGTIPAATLRTVTAAGPGSAILFDEIPFYVNANMYLPSATGADVRAVTLGAPDGTTGPLGNFSMGYDPANGVGFLIANHLTQFSPALAIYGVTQPPGNQTVVLGDATTVNSLQLRASTYLDFQVPGFLFNATAPKGSLLVGNSSVYSPLSYSGVDNHVLTVDTTNPNGKGLKWSAAQNIFNTDGNLPAAAYRFISSDDLPNQNGVPAYLATLDVTMFVLSSTYYDNGAYNGPSGGNGIQIGEATTSNRMYLYYDVPNNVARIAAGTGQHNIIRMTSPDSSPVINVGDANVDIINLQCTNFRLNNAAATGSLLLGNGSSYSPLAIGTNGKVLSSNGTTASWQTISTLYSTDGVIPAGTVRTITPGDASSTILFNGIPVNVRSDLYVDNNSGGIAYASIGYAGTNNILTCFYDTAIGNTGLVAGTSRQRLIAMYSANAANPILSVGDTALAYVDIGTLTSGYVNFNTDGLKLNNLATKGSLLVGNNTVYKALGVGSNGQVLTADSTMPQGVKWASTGVTDPLLLTTLKADNIQVNTASYINLASNLRLQSSASYPASLSSLFLGISAGNPAVSTSSSSTIVGHQAGVNLTSGGSNTFLGTLAGQSVTIGTQNTMVGKGAGTLISSGNDSVIVGAQAGVNMTGSTQNTIIGTEAGFNITGASVTSCVIVGYKAGYQAISSYNTLVGQQAGYSMGGAGGNTAIGYQAGFSVTGGTQNTFLGAFSGLNVNSSSSANVFIGYGVANITSLLSNNVVIGAGASIAASSSDAVGIGRNSATTGSSVAIGSSAIANGSGSVAIGYQATTNTGGTNVAIGYLAVIDNPFTQSVVVGSNSHCLSSQAIVMGWNSSAGNNCTVIGRSSASFFSSGAPTDAIIIGNNNVNKLNKNNIISIGAGTGTGAALNHGDVQLQGQTTPTSAAAAMYFWTQAVSRASWNDGVTVTTAEIDGAGNIRRAIGSFAEIHINNGAIPVYTTITTAGTFYSMNWTSSVMGLTSGGWLLSSTNPLILTYAGITNRTFRITISMTTILPTPGFASDICAYVLRINGGTTVQHSIVESQINQAYTTNVTIHAIVTLASLDYIELLATSNVHSAESIGIKYGSVVISHVQ